MSDIIDTPDLKPKRGRPPKLSFSQALKQADEAKRAFHETEKQHLHDKGEQAASKRINIILRSRSASNI